jgi:hypothetical protein
LSYKWLESTCTIRLSLVKETGFGVVILLLIVVVIAVFSLEADRVNLVYFIFDAIFSLRIQLLKKKLTK